MPITFAAATDIPANADLLAVPVFAGVRLPAGAGADVDIAHLKARGFDGRAGQVAPLAADDGTIVIAVGVGDPAKVDAEVLRRAAAAFVRSPAGCRSKRPATTLAAAAPASMSESAAAAAVAEGAGLAAYHFATYKSSSTPNAINKLTVIGADKAAIKAGIERAASMVAAGVLARDLVNEPAGTVTPTEFAERARAAVEGTGVSIDVWDEDRIAEANLGGILGVAAGSDEPPRLVRFEYVPDGVAPDAPVLALVGKGITFDSGGLNLKTFDGMKTMKTDMSGAAAVAGAFSALGALGAPCKVIGYTPLSENMPSGKATRPGDVLRIRNGTTVEVLNTDAEGRLVLADAISLAVEDGATAIVDIATLTGACVQALGRDIGGLFASEDWLAAAILDASSRVGESLWRLPLFEPYRRHIDSEIADIKNIGVPGQAGALSAALFLREFTSGVPWAHLDIAGPARWDSDDGYLCRGGTGFGARTLLELATSFSGG